MLQLWDGRSVAPGRIGSKTGPSEPTVHGSLGMVLLSEWGRFKNAWSQVGLSGKHRHRVAVARFWGKIVGEKGQDLRARGVRKLRVHVEYSLSEDRHIHESMQGKGKRGPRQKKAKQRRPQVRKKKHVKGEKGQAAHRLNENPVERLRRPLARHWGNELRQVGTKQ